MRIKLQKRSLVVLIGVAGSGKSSFARKHFEPTEILSSDGFRGMLTDDENDQRCTKDVFRLLHRVAGLRLRYGRLTVIDATNVLKRARRPLLGLARRHRFVPVAVVFDLPEDLCRARAAMRDGRVVRKEIVAEQALELARSLKGLGKEGFQEVHVFRSLREIDAAVVTVSGNIS